MKYIDEMEGIDFKKKREGLGLTQAKLAEMLEVKPNTVARWENGVLAVPKVAELALQAIEINFSKKKAK